MPVVEEYFVEDIERVRVRRLEGEIRLTLCIAGETHLLSFLCYDLTHSLRMKLEELRVEYHVDSMLQLQRTLQILLCEVIFFVLAPSKCRSGETTRAMVRCTEAQESP